MKLKFLLLLLVLLTFTNITFADVWVNGYTRRDGTYVSGHYRSSPNSTRLDNYSSRGNFNPYTGKVGSTNPYNQYGSVYNSSYQNHMYSNNFRYRY